MDDNLQKMLNEMIENKELKPNTPNKLKNLFKLLPFSNSFFNLVDKTGIPMSQIVAGTASSAGQMQRAMKSANVAKGLTFAQPLFAGIDLLLLPVAFFYTSISMTKNIIRFQTRQNLLILLQRFH